VSVEAFVGTASGLTGGDNYFEDFEVGARFRHARGKTVTPLENVLITNLVMNTADAHFNEERMSRHRLGQSIVFGGITASIVIGLASQDASDNMVADLGVRNMRLTVPVVHGDTLYAATEVRGAEDLGDGTGVVDFHHWGINQNGAIVFEIDRRVRIRKRDGGTDGNGVGV
jgi:acyl dehydratase